MRAIAGIVLLLLSACVANIPIAEQSPNLSYVDKDSAAISIVDERAKTREGLAPDVIGKAHGVFGIPSSIKAYPWFEDNKEKKKTTLAQALEDRLVFGLNEEGWNVVAADFSQPPSEQEIRNYLQEAHAQNLVVLILHDWFVRINMNWVSAFNFDWDVTLKIFDSKSNLLLEQSSSGRDVVDEEASESYPNLIRVAFRDRLAAILDTKEVQDVLATGSPDVIDDSSAH